MSVETEERACARSLPPPRHFAPPLLGQEGRRQGGVPWLTLGQEGKQEGKDEVTPHPSSLIPHP